MLTDCRCEVHGTRLPAGNLLLAARRHHRQVVGSDVNTDSNEDSDEAEPESPIMMCAPPVRSLAMAMMTFAVWMQMFGIVHGHARLQIKSRKLGGVPSVQAKIMGRSLTEATVLT